ncbi:hypothetical protein ES708_30218 [subsurface metagenome]
MPKITQMYAFVAEDSGPDDEGITGIWMGEIFMPLVGADMARVNSLRPAAEAIARKTGKPIKLLHFSQREELEVIQ